MATDKIQTGIRFHEEMLKKITYIAKKNHRSLNAQLACERYEQSTGETLPPESEFYITVQVYPKATE